ncbi:docking protein 3 [Salminus brasiliensis]|uniref:docking protein 3 n=1 Tax=Salminus brasiliensis TaxID=930266 RepID=UPI003B832E45
MDVVAKEGSLFLQGVKFGKRIWRKTWVILFEPTPMGIGRIEMYDMRDGGGGPQTKPTGLKKAERRVVRLADCLSITPAPGESCPTGCAAFYLNTTQRTYTLADPMQDEWVPTLCQLAFQRSEGCSDSRRAPKGDDASMSENDLYSTWSPGKFQVTVKKSEASVRCCMAGSYLLSPEKEALCLLDLKTGKPVFYWPYRFLRRFGQIKEGVTIEAGRRCQTGEGHFVFLSKQGAQIYRAIEEAIMHQSVQDLLSKVTSQQQDSTAQQPPARPVMTDQAKCAQDSSTRGLHDRPYPALPRRNLALPAPPAPTPPTPPAISSKPLTIVTQPPVVRSSPPISTRKPPASTTEEVLYATIQPHPKPRVKTAPLRVPRLPAVPSHSPTQPKQKWEPEKETKERCSSTSDEDPDSDYCNWKQGSEMETGKGSPNIEELYSKVVPPPRHRTINSAEAGQDQAEPSRNSPPDSASEFPVNFKQTLSNVLFKDLARITPPRLYGGSCDHLSKLDLDEMDYCEVRK